MATLLQGAGRAPVAQRQAAFTKTPLGEPLDTLVHKVTQNSSGISDQDFAKALATNLDDDQAFELVVCAAVGEATRQYEAALAALEAASAER
jgi:hypothetical protein